MNHCCAFCNVKFDHQSRDRRVERETTINAMSSRMDESIRNAFADDTSVLRVLVSLAVSPNRCLCNYCHTRATVSREAAEAL